MEINGNQWKLMETRGPINGNPPVPLMEGPPPFNGKDRPFPLNAGGVVDRDRLVDILGNLLSDLLSAHLDNGCWKSFETGAQTTSNGAQSSPNGFQMSG